MQPDPTIGRAEQEPNTSPQTPPPPGDTHDEEARAAGGAGEGARRLRLLVVDDAPDVTEMIATMMSFAGYQVKMAFSAPEAFDAARGDHFDAVISDIGMPGMNGYQLAEALRALPAYERTPLIAVTGFTMFDDRERARRAGFDDFLTKPINPSDLLDAVRRLCG
ncbi:MAG TPA: response regulator [Pyrinomonadaceae bacterium]|nr:response regulator [Pyrinomonadaceae bacterium]